MDEEKRDSLREEARAKERAYYAEHREKIRARKRAKVRANHDKYLAYWRARRERNRALGLKPKQGDPEKRKAYYKAYYKEHRDRIRAARKLADAQHPERATAQHARYYEKNRERLIQYERDKRGQDPFVREYRERRDFFKQHPRIRRIWWIFRSMISWEKLTELTPQIENGPCDICGITDQLMRFDHDHKTLKFRGLLCHGCNVALGHFADDPAILQKALAYLQRAAAIEGAESDVTV